MIYERGVERTFLSVLHTKEVKSFFIKYRVHAQEYDLTEPLLYDLMCMMIFHLRLHYVNLLFLR